MRDEVEIRRITNGYIVKYQDSAFRDTEKFLKDFVEIKEFLVDYWDEDG